MRTAQKIAESVHTFETWQSRGSSVNKSEKAVVHFHIWKCASKETQNSDEMTEEQKEG